MAMLLNSQTVAASNLFLKEGDLIYQRVNKMNKSNNELVSAAAQLKTSLGCSKSTPNVHKFP